LWAGLTYGVRAWSRSWFVQPIGELYVTTVDPNGAVRVMLAEAKRLDDAVGDPRGAP
jgi:hypothetical protein